MKNKFLSLSLSLLGLCATECEVHAKKQEQDNVAVLTEETGNMIASASGLIRPYQVKVQECR